MDKNGLSAFLLGLGVGVGIGMLFAPKSGQETREFIKNKAGEGTDFIKTKAGEGSEFLKQRSGEVKQTAAEWVDRGKEALGRQKENLQDAVEAGRQAYREAMNQPPQPPPEGLPH
jgi:gas vesicle protein